MLCCDSASVSVGCSTTTTFTVVASTYNVTSIRLSRASIGTESSFVVGTAFIAVNVDDTAEGYVSLAKFVLEFPEVAGDKPAVNAKFVVVGLGVV